MHKDPTGGEAEVRAGRPRAATGAGAAPGANGAAPNAGDGSPPRPKARSKAAPKEIKRLRRDERFYVGGSECMTREQLIATFARKLHFPEWWTPDWNCFERCMCDLTWLTKPWPPRRICSLTIHDADYLLEREPREELVSFFAILECARRRSLLPFEFEGLVRKEAPMRRIRAALDLALGELGLDGMQERRVPMR